LSHSLEVQHSDVVFSCPEASWARCSNVMCKGPSAGGWLAYCGEVVSMAHDWKRELICGSFGAWMEEIGSLVTIFSLHPSIHSATHRKLPVLAQQFAGQRCELV